MMVGEAIGQIISGFFSFIFNLDNEVLIEAIKISPTILFYFLLIVILILFFKPLRELIPKISSLKFLGVETTFVTNELNKAADQSPVKIPYEDRTRVLNRANRAAPILKGAQILWVDDHPDNNLAERKIFKSWGTSVDLAWNTEQALTLMKDTKYDVIISDIKRDNVEDAGVRFLMAVKGLKPKCPFIPLIFYANAYDESKGLPPHAFSATNRADYLLHSVIDILEREKS